MNWLKTSKGIQGMSSALVIVSSFLQLTICTIVLSIIGLIAFFWQYKMENKKEIEEKREKYIANLKIKFFDYKHSNSEFTNPITRLPTYLNNIADNFNDIEIKELDRLGLISIEHINSAIEKANQNEPTPTN